MLHHAYLRVWELDCGLLLPKLNAAERGLLHAVTEYEPGPGGTTVSPVTLPASCLNFTLQIGPACFTSVLYSACSIHALQLCLLVVHAICTCFTHCLLCMLVVVHAFCAYLWQLLRPDNNRCQPLQPLVDQDLAGHDCMTASAH